MQPLRKLITTSLFFAACALAAQVQELQAEAWDGVWVADGSDFSLRLEQLGEQLHVEPVQALGFTWRNSVGVISDDSARFIVEYQGARASVTVVKDASGTAIARPNNCTPEFHIICALIRSQHARFTKATQ